MHTRLILSRLLAWSIHPFEKALLWLYSKLFAYVEAVRHIYLLMGKTEVCVTVRKMRESAKFHGKVPHKIYDWVVNGDDDTNHNSRIM